MFLGPDFWEGDCLKISHTQDELVLWLHVAHFFAVGSIVVAVLSLKPCGSLSSPCSPDDIKKLQCSLILLSFFLKRL